MSAVFISEQEVGKVIQIVWEFKCMLIMVVWEDMPVTNNTHCTSYCEQEVSLVLQLQNFIVFYFFAIVMI